MLPDYHQFDHIAVFDWHWNEAQLDWVESIQSVEQWLNSYIGPRYTVWAWSDTLQLKTYQSAVAFKREPDCTFFLLHWSH